MAQLHLYLWELGTIAICLLVLVFCSLAEAALVRVELARVRQLAGEKRRGAQRLERLVERRQEVLNSLVLLINLSVVVASAYATKITILLSGGSERWVPVTSLAMIAVIVVLCEVTPKTYAVRRVEAVGLVTAPILTLLHAALRPIARGLYLLGIYLIRRVVAPIFGGEAAAQAPSYSDEEVMALVSAGEAEGSIQEEEKEMIHGVIEFADKVAREVMTPRTDMACLPTQATLTEAVRVSEETGYSRLPVYELDVDHIIGIVYAKDMVAALAGDGGRLTVGDIARKPAPVVPESKKVSEVLHLMQRNRLHMAIVIDEYGGTAGLVTIEDLLEEIFGEIRDEYDVGAEPIRVISEREVVADARVSADEIEDQLGVKLPEGEYDSVGGFILDQLGRLPAAGEVVVWDDLEFTVQEVSENRILRVRVVRKPAEQEE
jgi:putative hemolysin